MTGSVVSDGPVWNIERRESSGELFWASNTSKVKFRCDVEVKEYIKDPNEHRMDYMEEAERREEASMFTPALFATCFAAVAVTVVLPYMLFITNA